MTPRQKFKQCLLSGWLTHNVWQCAAMIMIDEGLKYTMENTKPNEAVIENFLRDIKVPPYPNMTVCRYIAVFYPRTSRALFAKKAALEIFWKEKQQSADYTKTLRSERRQEDKKDKTTIFIALRSLSKQHDWKTVK